MSSVAVSGYRGLLIRTTAVLFGAALWSGVIPVKTAAIPQTQSTSQQTTVFTGQVIDAQTEDPIPSVNVFLSGTTLGATTDSTGRYRFTAPPGSYELVASIIGYQTGSVSIDLSGQEGTITHNFELPPAVYEVGELQVSDTEDLLWQDRFQRFRQQFIGDSQYARETSIENPYYLEFESTPMGTLTATARQPLKIVNRALGYRITFYLDTFAYNAEGDRLRYRGWTSFERLAPESEEQAQEWHENRRRAYSGSIEHLMRAAISGNLQEEGFYVKPDQTQSFGSEPLGYRAIEPERFIQPTDTSHVYKVSFDGTLQVIYVAQNTDDWHFRFRSNSNRGGERTSRIRLRQPDARVHAKGYLYDPLAIRLAGAMSHYRVAETLPANYSPE